MKMMEPLTLISNIKQRFRKQSDGEDTSTQKLAKPAIMNKSVKKATLNTTDNLNRE
jgi:hypothetical protein